MLAKALKPRVRKIGGSIGVILPKEAVSRLGIHDGESLFLIEGPPGTDRVTTNSSELVMKLKKVENIIGRYHNTIRRLAN
jgi:hypothetical protein